MKKNINKVMDVYIIIPILCDYIIISCILLINHFAGALKFLVLSKERSLSLISTLIGTTVSMAGFILAALTIIVTFKSSITAKGVEPPNNALEYLFKTEHYKKIVGVFKTSIVELTIVFLVLHLSWLCASNIKDILMFNILLSGTISMSLSIIRSLLVLFKIMNLEFVQQP